MSLKLIVKALETKVGNPLRKLILIKLADNASDQGECWPSLKYIADCCEISRRAVINHIQALEKSGFLRIEHRPGPKGNSSNIYHLLLDKPSITVLPSELDSPPSEPYAPPPGERDAPGTCHSLEPVNEPSYVDLLRNRRNIQMKITA